MLSCTMSDRIAAVGMVSAGLDPGWNWCTDHRPVPMIAFHGTADPICLYNGGCSKLAGGTFPSVPGFRANWSWRNRCRPNPIERSGKIPKQQGRGELRGSPRVPEFFKFGAQPRATRWRECA